MILDGENVYNDAIYAKAENGKVTVRDILGTAKTFENCVIVEVDVSSERLTLASISSK